MIIKTYKMFTFNIYVRTLIQVYLTTVIASTAEAYSADFSKPYKVASF